MQAISSRSGSSATLASSNRTMEILWAPSETLLKASIRHRLVSMTQLERLCSKAAKICWLWLPLNFCSSQRKSVKPQRQKVASGLMSVSALPRRSIRLTIKIDRWWDRLEHRGHVTIY